MIKKVIEVLLVDDEKELLNATKEYLEKHINDDYEFHITAVLKAQEALELIKTQRFECIVSDYKMEEMDGLKFLEEVRKIDKSIPFIIFTGRGREEVVIKALNLGATYYLKKGSDYHSQFIELSNFIKQSVEKVRLIKELNVTKTCLIQKINFIKSRHFMDINMLESLVVIIKSDETIETVNSNFCEVLGYTKNELIGKNWFNTVIPRIDKERMRFIFNKILSGDRTYLWGRSTLKTKEGKDLTIRWHSSLTKTDDDILRVVSIGNIITPEEELSLKEQRDELEFFARTVAHDLNNKLSILSLYNNLQSNGSPMSPYSRKIDTTIKEISEFLDNLLFLAKRGEKLGPTTKVDLNELVNKIIQDYQPFSVDMRFIVHPLPILIGHPTKLEQLFSNLILNVINHAQASKLTIWSKRDTERGWMKIFLRDDGKGIAPFHQQRIRAIWNRHKISDTSHGLGLLIVKKIVEAHGGRISFSSGHVNGTTFLLEFPLSRLSRSSPV